MTEFIQGVICEVELSHKERRMVYAGIDCGSTLLKAAWRSADREDILFATINGTEAEVHELSAQMRASGVQKVRLTGAGASKLTLPEFEVSPSVHGIDDEIRLQADGVRWLLKQSDPRTPKRLLIASIGTGVSYTYVSRSKTRRISLGSAHGGGTILGLARFLGVKDFATLETLALKGKAPNLLVRDVLEETAETPTGELIVAHFDDPDASLEDNCAGIFSFAAASVFKDLAILRMIPFSPKYIAVIGTVGCSEAFQTHLMGFSSHLKKGTSLHFLEKGKYAAALGAYLSISKS